MQFACKYHKESSFSNFRGWRATASLCQRPCGGMTVTCCSQTILEHITILLSYLHPYKTSDQVASSCTTSKMRERGSTSILNVSLVNMKTFPSQGISLPFANAAYVLANNKLNKSKKKNFEIGSKSYKRLWLMSYL